MFTTQEIARVSIFTALCIATALLVRFGSALIPFSLVPFAAVLAGATLGPRLGALAVVLYLILGLLGLPVFASPPYGGPLYLLTPSFGFLPGMALAAYLTGKLQGKGSLPLVVLVATLPPYLLGLPYFAVIMKYVLHKPLPFWQVLKVGFLPFFLGDLTKALAAVYLGEQLRRRLEYK